MRGSDPEEFKTCSYDDVWIPSSFWVQVPELEGVSGESYLDLGDLTPSVLERDVSFETFHLYWYEDHPECRPAIWLPTALGQLPPPLPDIPPSLFSVYVAWESSE